MLTQTILCLVVGMFSAQAAAPLARPNRAAREEALREIRAAEDGKAEEKILTHRLAGLKSHGFFPGPLCIEVAGHCATQRELGYHSSEYYQIEGVGMIPKAGLYTSVAEARFPGEAYGKALAFCES